MLNDDDWELFVPVNGDTYPADYQVKLFHDTPWQEGKSPGQEATYPSCFAYRKPKQKENKMPDRTPQQALKDAIASGAVEAWINGEEIEVRALGSTTWHTVTTAIMFTDPLYEYRPKPPKPTKIDWKPVVSGKEPKGTVLGYWGPMSIRSAQFSVGRYWTDPQVKVELATPTHWAPMCNLPEGDE